MTKEEYLQQPIETNEQFIIERVLTDFSQEEIQGLKVMFNKLDEVLYKSWAKDMSFSQIKEAIDSANDILNTQGELESDDMNTEHLHAIDALRNAISAKDIQQIKAAYDLLNGEELEDFEELEKEADLLLKEQIKKELTKAVANEDYDAFIEAQNLLTYYSMEIHEEQALWSKAETIFIKQTKIQELTYPEEKVNWERVYSDRKAAIDLFEKYTTGRAYNAYDFYTRFPGQHPEYIYCLVDIDIMGEEFVSCHLAALAPLDSITE